MPCCKAAGIGLNEAEGEASFDVPAISGALGSITPTWAEAETAAAPKAIVMMYVKIFMVLLFCASGSKITQ